MSQKKKNDLDLVRDVVGTLIEEAGADAVVIVYSKVKKGKTETYLIPYGNALTCNALIDYAYENYEQPRDAEVEVEDEEEDYE